VPLIERAAAGGLARFADAFVERGAFEPADAQRVAAAARAGGLGLRLHVDQMADGDGARLAASLGATAADHLDFTTEEGVAALAAAGTVAVLLPGATLTLGGPGAPLRALRAHGVPTAVATDFNPGTSTLDSLPLALALACRLYRLTPEEAFAGATEAAAQSLGLAGCIGCLRPGADADVVIWEAPDVPTLSYHLGPRWARDVFRLGRPVVQGGRWLGATVW
jgi:imidazolonepropionase